MTSKLLSNRSQENLSGSNDYFGHKKKADAIRHILVANKDSLAKNNMFVLYGEWGSGKSSVMGDIYSELNKGAIYRPIFFTAWEHEKDENLALSLIDAILGDCDKSDKIIKEFIKGALSFLKNLTKGLIIKTPEIKGIGVELEMENVINGIEEDIEKRKKEWSFFRKLEEFKKQFIEVEKKILKNGEREKLIIFIDDLDRCEPQNMLTLLSAIKLFFALGENTIFFFGVDKEAVNNAVSIKYGNVIKTEEYMEKIFDVSFDMPKKFPIEGLVSIYFKNETYMISEFFQKIGFTTPRHLKKVLNKYEIIKSLRASSHIGYFTLIPYSVDSVNPNTMDIVFVLFFIVLYEFYYEKFIELEDYNGKTIGYARALQNTINQLPNRAGNTDLNTAYDWVAPNNPDGCCYRDISGKTMKWIFENSINKETGQGDNKRTYNGYIRVLSLFTPKKVESFKQDIANKSDYDYLKQFELEGNELLVSFCHYLIENKEKVKLMSSDFKFEDFFEMARTLL